MKKQILKIIKRILLVLTVAAEAVFLSAFPAFALSIPSPSSVAAELERRYHLNLESIQNQGENFNVSDQKKNVPEVMLFFNPADPRPGEKITAEALPQYFNIAKEQLYYTWYLRHSGCGPTDSPSSETKKKCDADGNGKITVNDWKVEAMRYITNNGYDTTRADYSSDDDKDGYLARWGGANKNEEEQEDETAYCYIHDFVSGINYELAETSNTSFTCPSGTVAKCVKTETLNCDDGAGNYIEYKTCNDTETAMTCDPSTQIPVCSSGDPLCIDTDNLEGECNDMPDPNLDACSSFGFETPTCSTGESSSVSNKCYDLLPHHLFPDYKGDLNDEKVGDNDFKEEEEEFWWTNPHDPDTADNGNRDEANAVGVGQFTFTWNYDDRDKVGVLVEGTSMIPAKHDDSSFMIMWAMPKNDCSIPDSSKSYYYESIKGYNVKIPAFDHDDYEDFFNDCLEDNLVDPKEGLQPKKLDVSLSYSPENPINDSSGDEMGDVVNTQATIANADQESQQLLYTWKIAISKTGFPSSNPADWQTICEGGDEEECILKTTPLKGINIPSLKFKLDLTDDNVFSGDGYGYLKVSVVVNENYPSSKESLDENTTREGRSDVIIKVFTTDQKIRAFSPVDTNFSATGGPLILNEGNEICTSREEAAVCYVLKNEIIGLKVDKENLKNFSWTINGQTLFCDSTNISEKNCLASEQQEINFFPATGDPGDKYTIDVTANDVETGQTIHLTRVFQVIDPFVKIISTNEQFCWPKYLGMYIDLDGNQFPDSSESVFQTLTGNEVGLEAEFHPAWLKNYIGKGVKTEWTIDGALFSDLTNSAGLNLTAEKEAGDVYNIGLNTLYKTSNDIRKALNKIWNISQFESTEKYMPVSLQVEVALSSEEEALTLKNSGKFLAGLLSHLPTQIMFLLRIILTIAIILITTGVVFAFIPETYRPKETSYEKS
ncbi:MAG: hypothetical protein NT136_00325 [Candidatus Moranbacteria bacterium]|nr:hypothetical protein [Candidatus Moranbacteria bacterium]